MEQPFDGIDEADNKNLGVVLKFFASKLPVYYSNPQLTWLLTILTILQKLLPWNAGGNHWVYAAGHGLPSRLIAMDDDTLSLSCSIFPSRESWSIFQDFLDSNHQQALNGKRCATSPAWKYFSNNIKHHLHAFCGLANTPAFGGWLWNHIPNDTR